MIVNHYMDQRMNEAVRVTVQIQSDRLRDETQRENDEFLRTVDESIKKIIKEQSIQRSDEQRNLYKALVDAYESNKIILDTYRETVTLKRRRDDDEDKDEEPFAGPDRGSKRHREGKEPESASALTETATRSAGRSTQGSRSRQASASESALAEEPMQTTSQMEEPSHLEFDTGADDQPIVQSSQHPECELAKQADTRSSFNELMDTPLDFSNFIMNRLRVDTLTLELLNGPTYDLMNGSYKSLIELEYHLEEVYKATTDQLDWVNPEGQQYPHNLLQPPPLIPDNRGRRVIPFAHFINNDLEYLRGGASSRKYTTSVTKMKAADYGHIKWIEDLNKDKKNRLMRIDELHKFSDGTLTDVRTALDDRLKGIRMRYQPQTIWRKSCTRKTSGCYKGPYDLSYAAPIFQKQIHPSPKSKSDTTTSTGGSNSSNPFEEHMSTEFRLKQETAEQAYEVSKEKNRTLMRLEEMKFLAPRTKDLSEDDAYWINHQKN
uniref:Retrovirus-related Pol polyprotein from transposon TNT 1-94 n=1 Tax=Tanacetum cinerariifolium TaxID=118510 RepID=A0A6L2LQV5_TANCI|nr:retrovirus-related Pol polyprotein from transposon TNT 1-94 [Tanacetum cinerariifolium]